MTPFVLSLLPSCGIGVHSTTEHNEQMKQGYWECDRWRKAVGTTGFDRVGRSSQQQVGERLVQSHQAGDTPLLL